METIVKNPRLMWLSGLILAGCLVLALSGLSHSLFNLEIGELQLVVFPFVVLFFFSLSIGSTVVPRVILGAIAVSAAVSLWHSQLHVRDSARVIAMAQWQGDDFEITSRRLREGLNAELGKIQGSTASISIDRVPKILSQQQEAHKFLDSTESLPAVIWGSNRRINISFHPTRSALLTDRDFAPWVNPWGYEFVTSVPVVGVGLRAEEAALAFLAGIVSAQFDRNAASDNSVDFLQRKELEYLSLAQQQAHWESTAHVAYAWWMVGNIRIALGLASQPNEGRISPGFLRCALQSFSAARKSLRYGDNPELLAALLNNSAVAHLLLAELETPSSHRRAARKEFQAAVKTLTHKNLYGVRYRAGKVARFNLQRLREGAFLKSPDIRLRNATGSAKRRNS